MLSGQLLKEGEQVVGWAVAARAYAGWRGPVEGSLFDRLVGVLWCSQIFQVSECLSWILCVVAGRGWAAAVVGGVAGPVSAAGSLPGDGDADVDAEQSGQEGCGEFGGEAE